MVLHTDAYASGKCGVVFWVCTCASFTYVLWKRRRYWRNIVFPANKSSSIYFVYFPATMYLTDGRDIEYAYTLAIHSCVWTTHI